MEDVVSVIIPTFNSQNTVEECVLSVLGQTYSNIEVFVIDDGSTDLTVQVLKKISDCRLHIQELGRNYGVAYARNVGLRKVRSRYVAFIDADDTWFPEKLSKQLRFLKENSLDFCCSGYLRISKSGASLVSPPCQIDLRTSLFYNPVGMLTLIMDYDRCGRPLVPLLKMRNDWALLVLLLQKGAKGAGMTEPLGMLRISRGSLTGNKFKAIYFTFVFFWRYREFNFLTSLVLSFFQPIISVLRRWVC